MCAHLQQQHPSFPASSARAPAQWQHSAGGTGPLDGQPWGPSRGWAPPPALPGPSTSLGRSAPRGPWPLRAPPAAASAHGVASGFNPEARGEVPPAVPRSNALFFATEGEATLLGPVYLESLLERSSLPTEAAQNLRLQHMHPPPRAQAPQQQQQQYQPQPQPQPQ
eukprot:RCo013195